MSWLKERFDSLGWSPQYAFGYGLSYTTFDYTDLTITPMTALGYTVPQISFKVTNTGAITGDEVAQLYLSVTFADPAVNPIVPMPVKQLRGFKRITLAPQETKTVAFELGPEELAFWSVSDDSFRVEAGAYTVQVGGSSDHLPLSETFEFTPSILYDSATGQTSPTLHPVLRNVVLNRPVFVSSIESEDPNLAGHNMVDGDLATRWSSDHKNQQWLYIDLGQPTTIERVILHWEAAYGKAYQIQLSDDAKTWQDIFSTATGNGGVDNLALSHIGRYIRLNAQQRGTPWGYSLWEFEVYGAPVVYDEALYVPLILKK